MGRRVCTNLFRTPPNDSFRRIRFARTKSGTSFAEKSTNPIPKTHLNRYVSAFRTFVRTTGVPYLNEPAFKMLDAESKDWESIRPCPRKQAGGIPINVLKEWEGFVSDSTLGLTERLFAWSFRVSVAAGLRSGALLRTPPHNASLNKRWPHWVRGKHQNQGKV